MRPQLTTTSRAVPFARADIVPEAQRAAVQAMRSGWITMGPETAEFEAALERYLGARHVVAVASCTAAIDIAIRSLRLPPGAIVLTPSLTFCGAVAPVVQAGLRPVLVDVASDTLQPTPASIAATVLRVGKPAAMIVQHMAGRPADVELLAAAADLPANRVVEDSAHGLGAELRGMPLGATSHAACFSFYATKNLPIGEGGAIATADAELADYARSARLHGLSKDAWRRYLPGGSWRYDVAEPGLKANMTDVQAAIGRAQLTRFAAWQARREELARQYEDALTGIPGLVLPSLPTDARHAWHLYQVRVTAEFGISRDHVIDALRNLGIGTSVHFIPVHQLSAYRRILGPEEIASVPVTDQVAAELLSLPMYPALTDGDVDHVAAALAAIAARPRRGKHVLKNGGDRVELAEHTA